MVQGALGLVPLYGFIDVPGAPGQRANGPKKSEPPAERERWQPTPLIIRQPSRGTEIRGQ